MSDDSAQLTYSTAKGYVQSAFVIIVAPHRMQTPDDTTFFLSFHMLIAFSVELYLKAYLRHHGYDEKALRAGGVRHNLPKLLEMAKAEGLACAQAEALVEYLGDKHESFEFRYMKPGGSYKLRPLEEIFAELTALDAAVDAAVGASAAFGRVPGRGAWIVPTSVSGWRIAPAPPKVV
jgi:hypothetical protein